MNIMRNLKDETRTPHDLTAEQELLGAILNNNNLIGEIDEIAREEAFFLPLHQKIYRAIKKFLDKEYNVTPTVLKQHFSNEKDVDHIYQYLLKLVAEAQIINNVSSLAKIIKEHYMRRQLIEIGEKIAIDSHQCDGITLDATGCIEKAEQRLFKLMMEGNYEANTVSINDALKPVLTKITDARNTGKGITGIQTGFKDIDFAMGGLQNSDLIILAARPSMGKTSLAINIALNAAIKMHHSDKDSSIAFFSLEMSSDQIANRILSISTGIDGTKLRMGDITRDDFEILSREVGKIGNLPMHIDDTAALSIAAIKTRARKLKRKHNVGLIIVDYLQLIRGSDTTNFNNKVHEIGEVSQGLKAIAKELNVPVIALSQLSRAVESREDKRPLLSDLRDSGNIEQDADIVMFIYREAYYLERGNDGAAELSLDKRSEAEILISKHRNGPTGTHTIYFNRNTTSFMDGSEWKKYMGFDES